MDRPTAQERQVQQVPRLWMPYREAARLYVGIDGEVLLAAIKAGELDAYEKPRTRVRKPRPNTKEYHSFFVFLPDVDAYIKAHWTPALEVL